MNIQLKNLKILKPTKGHYVLGAYCLVVVAGGMYNGMTNGNRSLKAGYDIGTVTSSTFSGMLEGIATTAFSPFVMPIYAYNKFKYMKKE